MSRHHSDADGGFTLIEMVIAMLVMSIAVVGIVAALSAMIELTSEHRGHAVLETGSRSFGEAAQEQAQFTTTLTAAVNGSTTTMPVTSTALLPRVDPTSTETYTYVSVDREVMRVTAIGANSMTVVRDVNNDGAATHAQKAVVVPLVRCPTALQLTPATGTYEAVTGLGASIDSVAYWDPTTKSFNPDRGACISSFKAACIASGNVVAAECGYGLFRATITVTTSGDSRLRNLSTTTTILLRSGTS